jgi:hypothetical protein
LFGDRIGQENSCESAGKVVDVKVIRMVGILLLVVTGLAMLEPQEAFAQG